MLTIKDLYNIVENKIANETQKTIIRKNMPPQIAERMYNWSRIMRKWKEMA